MGTSQGLDELLSRLSATAAAPFERATDMPREFYTSPELLKLEEEHVFAHAWQCPGRAADIPNPGDYITYTIGEQPIFCIRGRDGSIRTFANVCRHRMMQLLQGSGNAGRVVCPYHAWSYGLDGRLVGAPHADYFADFDKSKICLPEIRTEIWLGWIYVTLDPGIAPVRERLAGLEDLVGRYGMENYIPVSTHDHVWDTNWKLLTQNFMESYHLPYIHKETVGGYFPVEDVVFPLESPGAYTYSTFTKAEGVRYGRAHPDNTRLEGDWRATNVLPTVFPSHMYTLAPDYMWYLSLAPEGPDRVRIRYGTTLAPEVVAAMPNLEAGIADAVGFLDQVNEEDRVVVEGALRGARAPLTEPGPLHPLERAIHHFIMYLAGQLAAGQNRLDQEAAE